MATYIAWTTTNFELNGAKVLGLFDNKEDAKAARPQSIAGDIYWETEMKNFRVHSLTKFRKLCGKAAADYAVEYYQLYGNDP